MLYALCPDCHHKWRFHADRPLAKSGEGAYAPCPVCGGKRGIAHAELPELFIGHLDCDAFYASIEKRDRPELMDQPVIIGGGHRGVVSTCCYVARKFGVRSAMPAFKARELCPDGVFLKPDMAKYQREGYRVRDMMRAITPDIEPLSIDEAFLDLTNAQGTHGKTAAECLIDLQAEIRREVGITVSIGLSYNKFLAKIASDLNKPFGFSMIGSAEAVSFLADKPVRMMWGVGPAMERKLRDDGITTIGQMQQLDIHALQGRYGSIGKRFFHFSRGQDNRRVEQSSERKSLSSETTFNEDISDLDELVDIAKRLTARVASDLARKEIAGHTVVLKLKSADFKTRTRNMRLTYPTLREDLILETALTLLKKEVDGTRYRLLGVGVADLFPADTADPADLFGETEETAPVELIEDNGESALPPARLIPQIPRPTAEQLRESLTRRYRQHKKTSRQHRFGF
ncbi:MULTISPECIES: DNA polymerase IV [Thalassospira]|uniref:DNA polymerase IV n=1 Tax=Thalassospira xiamenensis TaxID=220697 RepID=A0ABR5Y8F8_9PROT|nr:MULTISPECIES: DNA polymerase IV [Thalassospira]MBL4842544.1 DNA polymerase IV [Thalassospira sp.]MBR9778737.1 DNA polymerase IV [Rhodospirillales bacterium]KZD06993.1 DNA polymerase IV [Thalassospira xiamenensis]KZD09241.1 DNA polymerase IV [Thalassospira xiamenensis]MBR9817114.1 DNA polymerase IV [Rhodospirillales bacterium]|tara:strand:+ start:23420 stop:24790 length:1371 start_codon:yes stop_codon:yes gene_type:complete